MNSIGASILIILIIVVIAAPRLYALLGLLAGVLYLTQSQSIDLFGFNMFPTRFLEIAGFARVTIRREFSLSNLNEIDRAFIVLYLFTTLIFLARSHEGQAYQIGSAVDAFLCYVIFKSLVTTVTDFRWFLCAFLVLLAPYTVLILIESFTAHNPFAIWNPAVTLSEWFRDGRPRCFGSFRYSSLLGSLGASFLPLYIGLLFCKNQRTYAIIGIILSLGIVWCSNSGGPVGFAAFGILGWAMWSYRDKMRLVRWATLISFAAIGLSMKAPIWYLPAKFSFITGGDAWHRSHLMDVAFQHLNEWWIWGMPVRNTSDWFANTISIHNDAAQADITNEFISYGLTAGLLAIVLFIGLLTKAFQNLGWKLARDRLLSPLHPSESEYLLWGLGACLFGHISNFISVTYFDQFRVIWYMQLALVSTLTYPDGNFPDCRSERPSLWCSLWQYHKRPIACRNAERYVRCQMERAKVMLNSPVTSPSTRET